MSNKNLLALIVASPVRFARVLRVSATNLANKSQIEIPQEFLQVRSEQAINDLRCRQ